jgi:adenine-specific DNA methylase
MIPKECKRLAEVDFPIAAVSAHSAREKSIRHGHPSTLHLWWARRPLAACRAVLMALLLPDPCDENCPADFKREARRLLALMPAGSATAADSDLRKALLSFIADFANWDNSAKPVYLECARGLVRAAHGDEPPLVVDPFAGGGSIPLEALRVGCDAFASDLNPVACLILKVLLEDIPRHGPGLADELRRVGKQIKEKAERELAEFYPPDPDGARPIAYLWARTAQCEAVGCGAEIPLMRSFWLCKKASRRRALRLVKERDPKHLHDPLNTLVSQRGAWRFEIFEPKLESEVRVGTVKRGNATCPCCNTVLPVVRVRAQLSAHRGGADVKFDDSGERLGGSRLLAVVTLRDEPEGRTYRLSSEDDYTVLWKAQEHLQSLGAATNVGVLSDIPTESIPLTEPRRLSIPLYGSRQWTDLHTARQNLLLANLSKHCRQIQNVHIRNLAACLISKVADKQSTLCGWKTTAEYMGTHTFSRQALGMVWDFCEANPLGSESGSVQAEIDWIVEAVAALGNTIDHAGTTECLDACSLPLPAESAKIYFTDPPYYDAVPYSHLSDFFFVWLKRALDGHPLTGGMAANGLTPKDLEIVVDRPHSLVKTSKSASVYEARLQTAFARWRAIVDPGAIGSVVFAHKTTEGWEALLGGLLGAGWSVTASWPVTTEMGARLNARETAALAASVHLVCRPRNPKAGIGDWTDIYRELPKRIGDWMERLSGEGIRGADLVFACIGPALEVFSRHEKAETPDGELVGLGPNTEARSEAAKRGFLSYVWEVVGRTALETVLGTAEARARNSAAGALEEDARLTALFLWTLQSTNAETRSQKSEARSEDEEEEEEEEEDSKGKAKKGLTLIFDVVRRFAQPLGIRLPDWEGRIIETEKGIVRLLPVAERARQLFGEEGASAMAATIERSGAAKAQFNLFQETEAGRDVPIRRRGGRGSALGLESSAEPRHKKEPTTLDRVHAAMLLQATGASGALRSVLEEEQKRGPDFLRLANALSALYNALPAPYSKTSEEKRLLDAMLLAAPR